MSSFPSPSAGPPRFAAPEPLPSVGRPHAEPPHAQKILLIDDDDNLRDTVSLMLEREGFKTVLASEGRTGFEQALMLKPDLIVVDIRLPGMSGVEICKQLRASHVTTPIVVLSAVGITTSILRLEYR